MDKQIIVKCENCLYFTPGGTAFFMHPHRRSGYCRQSPSAVTADPLAFCGQFQPCVFVSPTRLIWPTRRPVEWTDGDNL